MDNFDHLVRSAVRESFDRCEVPEMPRVGRIVTPVRRQSKRWALVAAGVVLVGILIASPTRSVIAQVGGVAQSIWYSLQGADGRSVPLTSQSVTLSDALATPEFHVVAPAGLPPGANLASIHRVGTGASTMLIFDFTYGAQSFKIIEKAAGSQPNTIRYSITPPGAPVNRRLVNPGPTFKIEASTWAVGTTSIDLFAGATLTPAQIAQIQTTMR